jgi:mannose-6-phosphate isomerase-like protein (cupin superfamily)
MDVVNLAEKLASFDEDWVPKVVGELNGQFVKVVKFQGEYVWHQHAGEDELFLVLQGEIEIHFRDRIARLRPGEFCIVPRGVEHKPVASQRASVLLFEPATTRNTGNVDHRFTIEPQNLARI